MQDLRNLFSLKRRLKKEEHGLRVRIRNQLLAQYFPEMDQHFGPVVSLAVVGRCFDPSVIAGMQFDEFRRSIAIGRMNVAQQKLLQAIWQKAPESIGCHVGEAVPFEGKVMVSMLNQLRETIKGVDDKVEDLCVQFPEYPCLLSIPGFGPDVSSQVLGAIGNPFRFTSHKQVLKMAGFDLCAQRSGKTSHSVTPTYYTNKLRGRQREKGISTKMRVKLAAKLLVIAWTLMKKKEPFDPTYLNQGDIQL